MLKQVFISYRHESPEHARIVRRLGETLRQAKLPVVLDQFYLDDNPGGPDEGGWPKWCEDQASWSACVLIIASEGWFAAYEKISASGTGLGAATEADIFRQSLYDDKGINARIRLTLLDDISSDKIPLRLRQWHKFRPFVDSEQLNQLVRWAADCLGIQNIELPTVQWPEAVAFESDLADRKHEWPAIVDLLAGNTRERILLFEGATKLGKTALIRQTENYAKKLNIPHVTVDFKGGTLDIEAILGQFYLDLGDEYLPNFSREGASKVHLLRKDLRAMRKPVLLIFDTYQAIVGNPQIANWLNQQILNEVETSTSLCVILAGQQVPHFSTLGWRDFARHYQLQPITEIEQWQPWVERRYPEFRGKDVHLPTIIMSTLGVPGVVKETCDTIVKFKN
ncbi:MAG: TIR domain-containing protein [Gammaproteobacteria bacterium]|nr:TIR domain-containing protein [Gammaproteobacteria bacterium]